MRVYLSQAFVGSNDWVASRRRSEKLAELLRASGFEVYMPHLHTDPVDHAEIESRSVFEKDYEEIKKSDILLALLDEPSHGVGAEIALALQKGMTVLGVCSPRKKVSRFIRGLLETSHGNYFEYDRLEEVAEQLRTCKPDNKDTEHSRALITAITPSKVDFTPPNS